MRTNLSLHNITADDLEAGGGTKAGPYVCSSGRQVGFNLGRVKLFFDGPTEFAAWLTKLNALAADTPCVVEAMNPEPEFAATDVPAAALADYDRYCDQLVTFTPDVTPASLAAWWERYADNYDNPTEARAWLTECAVALHSELAKRDPLAHIDLRTFVHPEPADQEPMSTAVGTVPAAAAPVEPGSFSLCLEESGGYLCTRPVGHEDEHIASGVHDEHRHGGSVRWPQ